MTWNPFQYQFAATYLQDEGDEAVLELQKGAMTLSIRVSKKILPPELVSGQSFQIQMKDTQAAKEDELATLKRLLEELTK